MNNTENFPAGTLFNSAAPVSSKEDIYRSCSFYDLRFAVSFDAAVKKLVQQYLRAKKERDDWASRSYSPNGKTVKSRAISIYEQGITTVYEANLRRQKARIRAAQSGMDEALKNLKELRLTQQEINKLIGL